MDILTVIDDIVQFLQSQSIIQDYGLIAVFFGHMLPSLLPIMDGIDSAATLSGLSPIAIVIFAAIGGALGDLLWYFAGYYSYRKIKKIENKKTEEIIHRHKKIAFLYSAFPGGEFLMIYAGIKHYKIKSFLPFIIISNGLRSTVSVAAVLGIITLPDYLRQIF